jgi:hypothetical protein
MVVGLFSRGLSRLWTGENTISVAPVISTTPEVVARIVAMVLLDLGAIAVDVQETRVTFRTFFLALEGSDNPLLSLRSGVIDVLACPHGICLRIKFKVRFVLLPLVVAVLCAFFVHLTASLIFVAVGLPLMALARVGATSSLEHELRRALAPEATT